MGMDDLNRLDAEAEALARSREVRAGITTLKELWQDRDLQMNQLIRILRLLNERLDKIEGVIHSE
jgi:hypothetical protein